MNREIFTGTNTENPAVKKNLVPLQDIKKAFLQEAIAEKAHAKLPNGLTENQWVRMKNIGAVYAGSPVTYDDLRKQYGTTRERIRQLNKRFIRHLWNNCSDELKAKYPLETIPIGRKTTTYVKFADEVKNENDDYKLQDLLDNPSPYSIEWFCYNKKNGEGVLTTLSKIAKEGGFHSHPKFIKSFAETVRKEDIPIRRVVRLNNLQKGKYDQAYWILFTKHRERVLEALENNLSLQRFKENPVRLAFGTFNGQLPTTTELAAKKRYRSLGGLVYENFGIRPYGNKPKYTFADLLYGCPVPIFNVSKKYYYPKGREEELKKILQEKFQETQSQTSQKVKT